MNCLLIVDVQNDFLPGGALAVPHGDEIIPFVNKLQHEFDLVVATQDWHPQDHGSFAANHSGRKPGEVIDLNGLDQILWPVHCVQGAFGAEFSKELDDAKIDKVFVKGTDKAIDSYSGFFDNGRLKSTGLDAYLKSKGVEKLTVVGLAADYCVKYTALDAIGLGYQVEVPRDGTRAVNLMPNDLDKAIAEMEQAGIVVK
ncbi:MAG: bifunctional nicotinamidase/pyrazinamidase [Cyclobacteriaceae bacterium]